MQSAYFIQATQENGGVTISSLPVVLEEYGYVVRLGGRHLKDWDIEIASWKAPWYWSFIYKIYSWLLTGKWPVYVWRIKWQYPEEALER